MPRLQEVQLDYDPDGKKEQVAVVMRGSVYKESGLKNSSHPDVEGMLYDQLCKLTRAQYRDDVRKMAHTNAVSIKDKKFKPTVQWLDNFMRRFCLSKKKTGFINSKLLKVKIKGSKSSISNNEAVEAVPVQEESNSFPNDKQDLASPESSSDEIEASENDVIEKLDNGKTDILINGALNKANSISESEYSEDSVATVKFESKVEINGDNIEEKPPPDKIVGLKLVSFDKLIDPSKFTPEHSRASSANHRSSTGDSKIVTIDLDVSESGVSDTGTSFKSTESKIEKVQEATTSQASSEDIVEISDDETEDSQESSSTEDNSDHDAESKKKANWEEVNAVDFSNTEDKYYSDNLTTLQRRLDTKITQCTACFAQVNHVLQAEVFTHPDLGVLLCKKCHKFYGKGIFQKDEDGYDEYCRWCANGGDLYLCDKCTNGFCKQCVKRNLGRSAVRDAERSKSWICYVCDKGPLLELRSFHRVILDGIRSKELFQEGLSRTQINKSVIKDRFAALKVTRASKNLSPKKDPEISADNTNIKKEDPGKNKTKEGKFQKTGLVQPECLLGELDVSKVAEKNIKNRDVEDWTDTCIKDILELLSTISKKVQTLTNKRKGTSDEENLQVQRRLLRVSKYMKDSFADFEKYIQSQSGLEIENILIPCTSSSKTPTKTISKTPTKTTSKTPTKTSSKSPAKCLSKISMRSPSKRTSKLKASKNDNEISDSDYDEPKKLSRSPPKRKTVMKKRKKISESSEEEIPSPIQRIKCLRGREEEMEVQQASSDKETKEDQIPPSKRKRGDSTSNAGSEEGRNSSCDRTSSKNPNGSDHEEDEISQVDGKELSIPLSPIQMHDDFVDDNEHSVNEDDEEPGTTAPTMKNNDISTADDSSISPSISSSNFQCNSESILKDLAGTAEVLFEKENEDNSEFGDKECTTTFVAEKSQNIENSDTECTENSLNDSLTQMSPTQKSDKNSEISDPRSSNKIINNGKIESSSSKSSRKISTMDYTQNAENIVEDETVQSTELEENSLTEKDVQENKQSDGMVPKKSISSLGHSNDMSNNLKDTSLDNDDSESDMKTGKVKSNNISLKSQKGKVNAEKLMLASDSDDSEDKLSDLINVSSDKVDLVNQEVSASTMSQEESTIENEIAKKSLLVSESDSNDDKVESPLKSRPVTRVKKNSTKNLKVIPVDKEERANSKSSLKSEDENGISRESLPESESDKSDEEMTNHDSKRSKSGKKSANKNIKAKKSLLGSESDESNEEMTNHDSKRSKSRKKSVIENIKAKKSLLESESDESNDEIISLSVLSKAVARKSTSSKKRNKVYKKKKNSNYIARPKSVKDAKEKKQLDSGYVKIYRLDSEILKDLEDGSISVADYPHLLNNNFKGSDASALESDEEFESLLKFNVTRTTGAKEEDSEEESDGAFESESDVICKKKAKSKKSDERDPVKKKKKEGLMDISLNDEEEEGDEDKTEENIDDVDMKKDSCINDKMKKALLMSSDEDEKEDSKSDIEDTGADIFDSAVSKELEETQRIKYDKKKQKMEDGEENDNKEEVEGKESEDDDKAGNKKNRKYFSLKFSSDEEDNQDGDNENVGDNETGGDDDDDDDEDDEDEEEETPRKTRMFVDSDSDFEIFEKKHSKKKTTLFESSNDESDDSDNKSKKSKSRKRIKKASSTSEEDVAVEGDQDSPSKKRRRRIIRDEDLLQTTKDATQEEQERINRLKDKQKMYNQIFEIDIENESKKIENFVLDFDEKSKDKTPLVKVDEKLLDLLKPHQAQGIQFMYNATVESVIDLEENKKKPSGCILAHCMGLGKTLQVIVMVHTLLTNKRLNKHIERVMVCCPVNTVYNWVQEFNKWLKGKLMQFDVVELISTKTLWDRAYRLDDWYKDGGVCIIGYDMFRNLSNDKNKKYKGNMRTIFQKALVDPGPDFMVCDEGHILKNEKTALSIAINKIKTARRVVLTGTPLQNNLKEYHCMIQFVKPNLLGTKKEFMNRFVNPITAGQCNDALPRDVRRMKRRAHILHKLLEGCVQRFDYTVLKPFLPPKFEYVISVQLCDVQCKLYDYYLKNLAQGGPKRNSSGLFVDFNNLARIWSHPAVLFLALKRKLLKPTEDDELDDEEDLEGFIDDAEASTTDSSDDERAKRRKNRKKAASDDDYEEDDDDDVIEEKKEEPKEENPEIAEVNIPGLNSLGKVKADWWRSVLESIVGDGYDEDEFLNRIDISGKLYLLLDILRECATIGDKVLLFSQSILALDMIENFLKMIDDGEVEMPGGKEKLQFTEWKRERDYIRLDGSTSADIRKVQCKQFNRSDLERLRLFLISTRAGGVGINLVGANRVIIFDSSWNPSHDTQSIFRVYRFGQKKPCYIYRFVAQGTMEEKIYSRQVTKISTSLRVVDEHQIKRYFNMAELATLYEFNPANIEERETPNVPEDRLLAEMLIRNKKHIVNYHEHDSLLENQTEEQLSKEEREAAWLDFENEKKGLVQQQTQNFSNAPIQPFDVQSIITSICVQQPNISQPMLQQNVLLATQQLQSIHLKQFQSLSATLYKLKNPMLAPDILRQFPYDDPNELIKTFENQIAVLKNNFQSENAVINELKKSTSMASVSDDALKAAGLLRGMPSMPGNISNTAKYVARNFVKNTPTIGHIQNSPTIAHVQTNFKPLRPPSKFSKTPSNSAPMNDSGNSAATTSKGTDIAAKDVHNPNDVILLE